MLGEYFDLILNFGPYFMSTIGMGLNDTSATYHVNESQEVSEFQESHELQDVLRVPRLQSRLKVIPKLEPHTGTPLTP